MGAIPDCRCYPPRGDKSRKRSLDGFFMTDLRMMYAVILILLLGSTWAQQLSGAQMYMGYPGLGPSCEQALNTSVSCSIYLSSLSANGAILDADDANGLCVDSCYTSLEYARTTIKAACNAETDVIVYDDVVYPATFIVDNFLFTYNVSCRKDSKTGEFCDPQILAWSNQTYLTSTQTCSDCWLGGQAIQLSNPLGYDADLASNLASLTSSCSANGYGVTSPTAYALNSTATSLPASATATPPATCTGFYTVQDGDDCNSVAKVLKVSTYNLLYQNNFDLYCQNFDAAVGAKVCIPAQCETYTWQALDSCNSVVGNLTGVTVPQFLSWNPNFNSLCQNNLNYVGYEVCVSPPGGTIDYATHDNSSITTAATVAAPEPTNAMKGSTKNCGNWYTIIEGDTCGLVSVANYLSLSDFYFLNPEINENCTNLDLGVAYCVEPVGNLATYSGYTKTGGPTITDLPVTFSPVNIAIPSARGDPGYSATTSLLPQASGTVKGCETYRNYDGTNDLNDCGYIAYAYDVTIEQLLTWNPSLSANLSTCDFESGYSYCVFQSAQQASLTSPAYCLPTNANGTKAGTASDCSCFTQVSGYQNTSGYSCADLASDYSVTVSQLTAWNTWLSSDCDTALFAGLSAEDTRAVCIGINATALTGTTSSSPTVTISNGPTATENSTAASGAVGPMSLA